MYRKSDFYNDDDWGDDLTSVCNVQLPCVRDKYETPAVCVPFVIL